MRTEQLIRALAADGGKAGVPLGQRLAAALAVGLAASAVLFAWMLGPRPDFASVLVSDARFGLKFLVALTLATAAAGLALRLVRPGAASGLWWVAMLAAPMLLLLGIAYELASMPAATWLPRLIGRNAVVCLTSVPLLAAPILAAMLFILRDGAPLRPALAGAAAGLAAGGLGAALYAAHCTDDSPLFVAAWYGVAIAAVAAAGALAGARWLRW